MTHNEVRRKYIEFFKKRGHKEIPSASLVPENDPTSLFTSSGMQPLITYLLGEKHPLGKRLVDSQKCFRSQDIEEIGDNRHTTFFEMLGNWSLGDYFKKEQLPWIFEFLTKDLGLDPKRLYVSVFEGNKSVPKDTESIGIWKEIFAGVGIDAEEGERIFAYPAKKNWWSRSGEPEKMPTGEPGGPDSEVFFDFGEEFKIHEKSIYKNEKCHPNCDCGRYLEIANSVFMQYQKQADGSLKELPNKNVDFGGGLERMVAAANNNPDVFQTDIFSSIIKQIEIITNKNYNDNENDTRAMRIVADHIKASVFITSDGVIPSNQKQGYVLRRLLRRLIVVLARMSSVDIKIFLDTYKLSTIVSAVVDIYKDVYPNLLKSKTLINSVIEEEWYSFKRNMYTAYPSVIKIFDQNKSKTISGKDAYYLFESHGILPAVLEEVAKRYKKTIDWEKFKELHKAHQELSRTAAKGMFKGGLQDQSEATTQLHTATHLLQQALRTVLGDHVRQKGSHITAERLRFDFSHSQKVAPEEIKKVEDLVNREIKENLPVTMKIVTFEDALAEGALSVPGAKYPEKVKVYSAGNFSKEVCGGPHVDFTGGLGKFKIIKEEAAAANIRRVYAILQH